MSASQETTADRIPVVTREFVGRRTETEEVLAALPAVSQAALRQFSLERTVGYGVDYADAVELRGRVLAGQEWQPAATDLAQICLYRAGIAPEAAVPSRIGYLRRASALLRMSQMMMLLDTPQRREIFTRAANSYRQAAELLGDRRRVLIEAGGQPLAGWLFEAVQPVGASVIVIGGVEGHAMDFDSLGEAFAARGVDALVLDGPGQGETRLTYHHYLSAQWIDAYRHAVGYLDQRAPGRPIGFVGNSMGGSLAMTVAAADVRISACCDNGGIIAPWLVPPSVGTFHAKMVAFCGTDDPEQALTAWKTVTPAATGPNAGYPLLILQGGRDRLVSTEQAQLLFDSAPTTDKQMVVFTDGEHCIYNHKTDRDVLIADWMTARLTGPARPKTPAWER